MRNLKSTIAIAGILFAVFIALNFGGRTTELSRSADSQEGSSVETIFETQENNDGPVSVSVLPRKISASADLEFEVTLNTHSVELEKDLAKSVALVDDFGKEYNPIFWEGDAPGGHHRSGTLVFAPIAPMPKELRLIVRNIGGVDEREFRWMTGL